MRSCTCNPGFSGDGVSCADIDECLGNNGGCSFNAACTNTPGSRTCRCVAGYTGDGISCVDVDECRVGNGGCSVNAVCTNQPGSRSCACAAGFSGDGFTCTAATPTWTVETVTTFGGSSSAIALDAAGNPGIAYQSDSPRGVYFRRRTTSWSAAETVDAATNALNPSLAASSTFIEAHDVSTFSGTTTIAWVAPFRRSASFASWQPDATSSGYERPDLAVGGGREHLVAILRSGTTGTIGYSSRTIGGSSWSAFSSVGTAASGAVPKVAANASGIVVVAYRRVGEGVMLARSTGGSTFTSTTVTTARVWSYDVEVDGSGTAHLAYYTPDSHRIVVESWLGSSRTRQVTIDTPGGTAPGSMWYSGVSIAHDGNAVHAAWLDFTRGSAVVRYANDATGSFSAQTVTAADDILGDTSLAVTSSAVHLSFPAPSSSFSSLGYAVRR